MSIVIYGASDDLIEVEGDLREEFVYPTHDDCHIALSNGALLRCEFASEGVWRFWVLTDRAVSVTIVQAPADDEDNYSDRVTVEGDIRWVALATDYVMGGNDRPADNPSTEGGDA